MREIITRKELEPVGTVYEADELEAIIIAIKLYLSQIEAGNAPTKDMDEITVRQSILYTDEILKELESGSSAVLPRVGRLIENIYLPFMIEIHRGLIEENIQQACDYFELEPVQLTASALTARQMLSGERSETQYIT